MGEVAPAQGLGWLERHCLLLRICGEEKKFPWFCGYLLGERNTGSPSDLQWHSGGVLFPLFFLQADIVR